MDESSDDPFRQLAGPPPSARDSANRGRHSADASGWW
jgi:hypothetical protein